MIVTVSKEIKSLGISNIPERYFPVFGVYIQGDRKQYVVKTSDFFLDILDINRIVIQDEKASLFWKLFQIDMQTKFCGIPEWGEKYFYENLENEAPREIKLLQIYGDFLSREFSSPRLKIAIDLEHENWCQCPYCEKIFQNCSYFGIIKCPNCSEIQNNPFENHDKLYTSQEASIPTDDEKFKNAYFFSETAKYYQEPPHMIKNGQQVIWQGKIIE